MNLGLLTQYVFNGLMLGMIYAMVAVGFTLFFGVLDVIKFSHGDVLMVGAFTGLATYLGLAAAGVDSPLAQLLLMTLAASPASNRIMLSARRVKLPKLAKSAGSRRGNGFGFEPCG